MTSTPEPAARPLRRRRLLSTATAIAAATLALAPAASPASPVLPIGGVVAGGQASLTSGAASLTINQTSSKAIIDWTSFSIGQGARVQFDNGAGATLNRVTGAGVSLIDGLLSATGAVYLINPSGVIIGKTGVVETSGTFAASTLDIGDAAFLAGGASTFSGASGAGVINLGKVGSLGGDVALIAAKVENDGTITAARGDVGLAAGHQVVLSDATLNGGRFQVLAGGAGTSATNTGAIRAAMVELRANGGAVYALAGNTGGIIDATGVATRGGRVFLVAEGGTTTVGGTLEARGPGGAPGQIETSGQTVAVDAATIDAHGGTWTLDPQNIEITPAAAATISASLATNDVTEQTTARSASESGTTSGATVSSGAGDITLDAGARIAWTSSHKLTLQAYDDIVLDGPISLSNGTLDLTAGGSIAVNATVDVTGAGAVSLNAAENTTLVSNVSLLELSFAVGASIDYGPTRNGGTLSIDGQAYTLLYALSQPGSTGPDHGTDDIAGIDHDTAAGGLKGYYALATSVTQPTTQVFTGPLVDGYIASVFEGLGNTITNLTIRDQTTGDRVALFANLAPSGTIRDLGLIGGSVTLTGTGKLANNGYVAGILANNNGIVANVWTTGAVTGAAGDTVGGVVGMNYGAKIIDAFASGAITGGSGAEVGGLDGANLYGVIVDSYATGPVSGGGGSSVGGLVGDNAFGAITDAYATGAVSGGAGAVMGGLTAAADGTITNGYYDADTTGQPLGTQADGSVGLSTMALQAALPAGFSTVAWGQIPGSTYPYLLAFQPAPPEPQTLSGTVYSSLAGADLSGVTVDVALNGTTVLGSATTGSNGFYSITLAPGTLTAGATVVAYLASGSVLANAAADDIAGASLAGVNLYGGALAVTTPRLTLSALSAGLAAGLGSATSTAGSDILFSVPGGVLTLKTGESLSLTATGTAFAFDQALNLGAGTLRLTTAGPVSQTAGAITAGLLQGSTMGALSLGAAANQIAALGDLVTSGGALTVADAADLTITGAVNAGSGTVTLTDAGTIGESGPGAITAASLSGSSAGGASFTGANPIGVLAGFTNTGAGGFSLTDTQEIRAFGAVGAGTGTLALTTTAAGDPIDIRASLTAGGAIVLASSGKVGEAAGVSLTAASLTGSSVGGVDIASSDNHFAAVAGFTNTGAGDTTFVDAESLAITGLIAAGSHIVTLESAGAITETGAGAIAAAAVAGSGGGGVTLTGANQIGVLAGFTNTGAGGFSLTDTQEIRVYGAVDAGTGTLALTTTTAGDPIDLHASLTAGGAIVLASSGKITQAAGVSLTAASLTGASVGGADITSSDNHFAAIAAFANTGGGDAILVDGEALTVSGPLGAGAGSARLTTTAGDLTIGGSITAETVDLATAGQAAETGAGAITARLINVDAQTGILLTGSANTITAIGAAITATGPNQITK